MLLLWGCSPAGIGLCQAYASFAAVSRKGNVMKHAGRKCMAAALVLASAVLGGCDFSQNAIAVSNTSIDFSRNETPYTMYVWNNNAMITRVVIAIEADQPWILPNVEEVTSAMPADADNGPFDKRAVIIRIDRTQLPKGESKGTITLTSKGIKPRTVDIRVWMDADGRLDPLNVVNPVATYSKPYVIDFAFGLSDSHGNAVVAEPGQFGIEGYEDNNPVDPETGMQLRRAAARQLKLDLVMDYSLAMQNSAGAIQAMEDTAKNTLLSALNTEALAGVTEFHRDDLAATDVSDFTIDRAYTRGRIDAIQPSIVRGWSSGPRLFDAIVSSSHKFNEGEPLQESRYIVLLTAGRDTSSTYTVDQAVSAATQRGIHVIIVGFGQNVDLPVMLDLSGRTGGTYFPAGQVSDLPAAIQRVVDNLEGQYLLRWASLRRNGASFRPSFAVSYGSDRGTFNADFDFNPKDFAGNALRGMLRLVNSGTPDTAAVVLRADYMPRFINEIWVHAKSPVSYTANVVSPADDGIIGDWSVEVSEDVEHGGQLIHLFSPAPPLPFAAFGPLVRFDFANPPPADTPLFEEMYIDNSIYVEGEFLVIRGFHNPDLTPLQEAD